MAASNDLPSQPSSSSSVRGPLAAHYKVFLSFRGPDARFDFAEDLCRELVHGATPHVFRDEEAIRRGEEISSTSIGAIERSDISIPVISPRYAESKACLVELAHMSLLRKTKRHKVIPVFYLTEPRILEGFPRAFSNKLYPSPELDEFFGDSEKIIGEWKEALSDLANDPPKYYCLSEEHNRSSSIDHGGSTMQDPDSTWTRPRTELLSAVVSDVKAHLRWDDLVVPDELVGIDHHVREMMRKLGVVYQDGRAVELLRREEIRVVTITGISGIGKTTLAKVIYNQIRYLFQACSFLEDIHESLHEDRLESLQQRLLSSLNKRKFPKLDYETNINALNTMFKKTSVLIIIDDVHDIRDVDGLAADCSWFGPGSRIILTSNVKLEKTGLIEQAQEHGVEEMEPDLAIQLFLTHAYGQNPPQHLNEYDLSDLAKKIINAVPGIPSAIEAVGRSLHGKDIVTWLETLDQLKSKHATNIMSPSLSGGDPLASHYNVVLSFRGSDTRYHFADTLYRELKAAGISCVLGDEEEIHDGEDLNATLIQAIELSDISIPIISPYYADSKACLMELAHMSLCRKTKGHKVIPVFYLVEPSILEGFPEAFSNKVNRSPDLDKIISNSEKTVDEWNKALSDFVKEPPKYFCLSEIVTRSQSIDHCGSTMQDLEPTRTQNWRKIFSAVVSDVRAHLRTGTIFALTGIPSHSSSSCSYDVFISFRGSDTRRGFTDFLYHGLVDAGFSVYRDVEEPPGRVDARTEIMERSKIVIPIISCNYASSRFLMYELLKIYVFKKRTLNRSVIPIYYYVNPSHTCNCEGSFWDQIREHEKSGVDPQAIDLWKLALREIANLKGFWISDDCNGEALIMKRIISTVICQLHIVGEVVPRNLVGVEHHVHDILKKLNVVYDRETVGVRVVGIYGAPGVGKTTLARVVYDDLRPMYSSSAFLANIGERSLASLQGQLIWDLQKPEYTRPFNFEDGRETLKSKFRQKRVLIVLDDVGDFEQIKPLAANLHWFGPGSRIIITSKTKSVLDYYERTSTDIYELGPLEPDKALELLCKHAFVVDFSGEYDKSLIESICSAVGGLPLAIEIVGSYLKEKEIGTWKKTLQILESESNIEAGASGESSHVLREIVEKILQDISASDEHLGKKMKEMFFDIACFLFAADERFALNMWSSCNRGTNEGLRQLQRLCFVETAEKNQLGMHELLRGIGREMAEQEDLKKRGTCRRLWNHQDAHAALKGGKVCDCDQTRR